MTQLAHEVRSDRYADCRIRTGFAFDRHVCYATGDRKWSPGESRMIPPISESTGGVDDVV